MQRLWLKSQLLVELKDKGRGLSLTFLHICDIIYYVYLLFLRKEVYFSFCRYSISQFFEGGITGMVTESSISELLKHNKIVQIVFDSLHPYVVVNGSKIFLSLQCSEESLIKSLNKHFKVYFAALQSTSSRHTYTVKS